MRPVARVCWIACLFAVACCAGQGAGAQRTSAKPAPEAPASFGSVMGHVYLAGSNAPARLVNINLQSLQVGDERAPGQLGKAVSLPVTVYQTDLNGAYTIPHVAPGLYYVIVNAAGYLSPFTEFTREDLKDPTPEVARRIAASLPVIRVQPNATTLHDMTLRRGATLSGTVRFDDGTPFSNAIVDLRRHESNGKWVGVSSYSQRALPDVDGHWARTGLLPGEYRVSIKLELNDHKQSSGLSDNAFSSSFTRYSLEIFLGDTAHRAQAKTVKLADGEQSTGLDIMVPVSKLHAVSGIVVDQANGQPLNSGTVRLLFAGDGDGLASTNIDAETRTFTFPFVPEGEYRLQVEKPRESRYQAAPDDEGDPNFPERSRHETVVRQYGNGEMPVVVQGEMSGVSLPVKLQATKAQ